MKYYNQPSGLTLAISSDKERNSTMKDIGKDIDRVGEILYTPKDNIPYMILEENDKGNDKVQYLIQTNGKKAKVTCSFYNWDKCVNRKVRKLNNA